MINNIYVRILIITVIIVAPVLICTFTFSIISVFMYKSRRNKMIKLIELIIDNQNGIYSNSVLEKNNITGNYCLYHLYLPGYEDINKAATVWVIRNRDGTINIISNN